MNTNPTIKVLIVDDSNLICQGLRKGLEREEGIEVIGVSPDPYCARNMIAELQPDVITLDIEMPRMDGLTFLKKIMKFNPIPTIIVSSVAAKGCDTAIACIEAGALEVIAKPSGSNSIAEVTAQLAELMRATVCTSKQAGLGAPSPSSAFPADAASAPILRSELPIVGATRKIIAIGSSTGGTEALRQVLTTLPDGLPGIVMTQHMPEGFTKSFANRLNDLCEIEVREAENGDLVRPGLALLAPGDRHMRLNLNNGQYAVQIIDGPKVCRHRPSVDILFESVAKHARKNALGVILTGMGADGAAGLLAMRKSGAFTIAQDEDSCVVFGMPKEAIDCGGASLISPLTRIAKCMLEFSNGTIDTNAA